MDPKIAAMFKKAKSAPADPNFLNDATRGTSTSPDFVWLCPVLDITSPGLTLKLLPESLFSPTNLIPALYTEKYGAARAVDTKTAWAVIHRAEAPAPVAAPVKK